MQKALGIGLLLSLALSACSLFTAKKVLSPEAHLARLDRGCRISLSGLWPAVHTLFPGDRTFPMYADIDVPNLNGPIAGENVLVTYHGDRGAPWYVPNLSGMMTFRDGDVAIDFIQHNPGERAQQFGFNGTYKLVGPALAAQRSGCDRPT